MMMVALLLYAYCVGVPSSRKIERRTHEDIAPRVLAGNTHPDHTRISEFRRIHLRALTKLFVQVLRLCQKMGLVKLGHVALDGTKLKANASKHKAMSHERMNQDTARLEAEVEKLLKEAEQADADEDGEHGKGRRGDELPQELRRREGRLARIRALQADLVAEAQLQAHQRQAAQSEEAQAQAVVGEMNNIRAAKQVGDPPDGQDPPPPGAPTPTVPEPMPEHQVPVGKDGVPTAKAQRNFTDADSRIMKTGDGFIQGYNAQAMVDEEHQIIVAADVSNQSPDAEHLIPMLDRTIDNCQAVRLKDQLHIGGTKYGTRVVGWDVDKAHRPVEPHRSVHLAGNGIEPEPPVAQRAGLGDDGKRELPADGESLGSAQPAIGRSHIEPLHFADLWRQLPQGNGTGRCTVGARKQQGAGGRCVLARQLRQLGLEALIGQRELERLSILDDQLFYRLIVGRATRRCDHDVCGGHDVLHFPGSARLCQSAEHRGA